MIRRVVIVAGLTTAALLGSIANALAQSLPSVEDVLAKIASVRGARPASSYERISYTVGRRRHAHDGAFR